MSLNPSRSNAHPPTRRRSPKPMFATAVALVVALLGVVSVPAQATAKKGSDQLKVGFADDVFSDALLFDPDPNVRELWFKRIQKTQAELVRVNVYWNRIASGTGKEPVDPRNPEDPAYNWGEIDKIAREATARGLDPLFTVLLAPPWAEGSNRPSEAKARSGTWKPNANKFEDFAAALATRYSGGYPDPASPGQNLPAIKYFEGWNEPNLQLYINPQREGKTDTAPAIYRDLLNGFYAGIKSGSPAAKVIGAGTGPFGDPTGDRRIPPKEFWREVFCLREKGKRLKKSNKGCPSGQNLAHMDIFAHNGINETGTPPTAHATLDDNATAADMSELVDIIRAAEKYGTVLPANQRRQTWSTEMWFESNPPERRSGFKPKVHARYLSQVLYLLWKQKISAGVFLQIRDSPYDPKSPAVIGLQSGVYFLNNKAKPALDSVRFPFYAERKGRKVFVWGKAPQGGKVTIRSGKRKVAKINARGHRIFTKKLRLRGKQKLSASIGKFDSVQWKVKP